MDRALTWSYGGGTQSIAIAILVAQGRLPTPERIVMADTGREASETWEYHERYTGPLLASVGLTVEIAGHDLATVDLYGKNADLLLPAFLPDEDGDGAADGKLPTLCSNEWKQRVFRRYLRAKGYGPERPITTWLGISLDETQRLKQSDVQWQKYAWPLCFTTPMRRGECAALVVEFGWPEPPKSSCWMCPHRQNPQWARLKEHYPDDWQKAVELDRDVFNSHGVYLHRSGKPLDQADLTTKHDESPLFCTTAMCWN